MYRDRASKCCSIIFPRPVTSGATYIFVRLKTITRALQYFACHTNIWVTGSERQNLCCLRVIRISSSQRPRVAVPGKQQEEFLLASFLQNVSMAFAQFHATHFAGLFVTSDTLTLTHSLYFLLVLGLL